MDFASMAASKEARVPFVSKALISYCYHHPMSFKMNEQLSKLPLRTMAKRLGLEGALQRKKIGFSAQSSIANNKFSEYLMFQKVVMETLQWS